MRFDAREFLAGLYVGAVATVEPDVLNGGIAGPGNLPAEWRVEWEERAAIREYEGGQAREHAEAEALTEILARMRAAQMTTLQSISFRISFGV